MSMRSSKQHANPRKAPTQARSHDTVDAILDACARLLIEGGYEAATTNRVARLAGVSVGSLYQYFPNKDAIISALNERHEMEMLAHLGKMVADLADAPLEDAIRTYVEAILAIHAADPKLHRALTGGMARNGIEQMLAFQSRAESVVRMYLERHRARLRPKSLELAAFLIVTAVESITHIAVIDRPDVLKQSAFADEVTSLVVRYLVKSPRSSRVP
jgi:AcrR family transcriptional regulator